MISNHHMSNLLSNSAGDELMSLYMLFWSGGDVKLLFIVICRLESCANDGSEQMDCEMKVQGCWGFAS